jgi:hypothetical protein
VEINDGGPAFPFFHEFGTPEGYARESSKGLSMRDWFAGMAFAHAMPKLNPFAASLDENRLKEMAAIAKQAYAYADAMISERQKGA